MYTSIEHVINMWPIHTRTKIISEFRVYVDMFQKNGSFEWLKSFDKIALSWQKENPHKLHFKPWDNHFNNWIWQNLKLYSAF